MVESSGSPRVSSEPQTMRDISPSLPQAHIVDMNHEPQSQKTQSVRHSLFDRPIYIDLSQDDEDDEDPHDSTANAGDAATAEESTVKDEPEEIAGVLTFGPHTEDASEQPEEFIGTEATTFSGVVVPTNTKQSKAPGDAPAPEVTDTTELAHEPSGPETVSEVPALPELPPDTELPTFDDVLTSNTSAATEVMDYGELGAALNDYLADVANTDSYQPGPVQHGESQEEQNSDDDAAEDSELDDKKASAKFQALKKDYEARERAGILTGEQEVKFRRERDEETKRRKRLHRQKEWNEENEMFFPEHASDDDIPMQPAPTLEDATSQATIRQSRKGKAQKSGYAEVASNASDSESDAERITSAPVVPKKRGRPPKATQKKAAPKSKVTKKPRKETVAKPKKRRKAQEGMNLVNLSSLYHNDIVAQAQANQGREAQPGFTATNKQEALKQLISSIPEEHRKPFQATKRELDRACKKFTHKGPGSMHADGAGAWRLKGMATSLYHYQLLGAAWCVDREQGSTAPFGGLIADSMGFGKTITMLSVILEGLPKPRDRFSKKFTTLIVCPSTLCSQWLQEIKKHIQDPNFGEVLLYRSGSRIQSNDPVATLSKYTIVITSYNEIMSQYPKCKPPEGLTQEAAQVKWWANYYEAHKGPLLRVPFRRVVLDEAQIIKNPAGRTSRGCRALTAKYRWALSGTPILNCLEELFSYFNFLGVDGAGTFEQFKVNYCKRTSTCMERLDTVLRKIMIRRTGADEMFGRPILQLPSLRHETIMLDFSATERAIYAIVKHRFVTKINQWSVEGSLQKRHRSIFVMLLRLRQMTAHIFIIFDTIKELLEAEDLERLWKLTDEETRPADPQIERGTLTVLRRVLAKARNSDNTGNDGDSPDRDEPQTEVIPNNLTGLAANDKYIFKFRKIIRKLYEESDLTGRTSCRKCYDAADEPRIAPCGHLYCMECIYALINDAKREGRSKAMCLECSDEFSTGQDLRVFRELDSNSSDRGTPSTVSSRKRKHGSVDSDSDGYNWLNDNKAPFLSSKVQAIRSTIKNWLEADPATKIIVFSLFLPMLEVLERVAALAKWGVCSYTGKMSADAKDKAVQDFGTQADKSILFASLRAGGLGLNLTMASKCIIVDPWWNECTEDQAFSRVFRIGQKSAVEVRRFVINDTIDTQLLLKMQQRKTREIKRVMGDGRDVKDLSVQDLMRLFGPVDTDPLTGAPVVGNEDTHLESEFVFAEDQYVQEDSDGEARPDVPERPWTS